MISKYSNNSISCFSLVISLVIFLAFYSFVIPENRQHAEHEQFNYYTYTNIQIENNIENAEWILQIPKLNLQANIEDGTNEEVLENSIGHFIETSKWNGNIGLAAHNRGYENNYFQFIKELENGDELIYCYHGNIRTYSIIEKQIIKNTNWSYLARTDDNRITLITCVENMPEYRLCVQAIQK